MALHEETLIDHRFGRIMNANIAEYHVPVNADVHDIKVIFVDEPDEHHQSAGHQGRGRDRHRRRGGGDRQRGLSRDRQARARSADHARQVAAAIVAPRSIITHRGARYGRYGWRVQLVDATPILNRRGQTLILNRRDRDYVLMSEKCRQGLTAAEKPEPWHRWRPES